MQLPTSPPAPESSDGVGRTPVVPRAPSYGAAAAHAPAGTSDGSLTVEDLCRRVVDLGASDLHLRAGAPPMVRIHGTLHRLGDRAWDARAVRESVEQALAASGRPGLESTGFEHDAGMTIEGIGRFRVHAYRERGHWAQVLRYIPAEVPDWDALGLPRSIRDWASARDGLVVVSGPTGSGKSTTLAALVDLLNQTRACHILVIEDPMEFVHTDRLASISQREVPTDTPDFAAALRAGMREDPDVIVVGEVRDSDTLRTALRAAETGHLVLVSVHARSVTDTVSRMLDLVPESERHQVRSVLAETLRGVVCQRLVVAVGGMRRCLVTEVAQPTARLRDVIRDPEGETTIADVLADGEFHGMHSMQGDAVRLVLAGAIDVPEAEAVVTSPSDLHVALRRAGLPAERLSSSQTQ